MASISATAPLRSPNFRWYFGSRSVNLIGNMMAPVALAVAKDIGASPYPFAMIIAIAASAAFMTPVSSPVNTLVVDVPAVSVTVSVTV